MSRTLRLDGPGITISGTDAVLCDGMKYRVHSISEDGKRVQIVNSDGLYRIVPIEAVTPDRSKADG